MTHIVLNPHEYFMKGDERGGIPESRLLMMKIPMQEIRLSETERRIRFTFRISIE